MSFRAKTTPRGTLQRPLVAAWLHALSIATLPVGVFVLMGGFVFVLIGEINEEWGAERGVEGSEGDSGNAKG